MALFFRSIYLGWFISLIYAGLLYLSDSYKRESLIPVGIAFTGGVIAIILINTIHAGIPGFPESSYGGGFPGRIFSSFVGAAIPEETIKLAIFFLVVRGFDFEDFSEGLDGMLYMGMIGAGFGAYEDFSYIFSHTLPYIEGNGEAARAFQFITWQRAFPGHVLINAVSGYFLGRARFAQEASRRGKLVLQALLVAILTHGLFNLAGSGGGTGWLIMYVLVLGRIFLFLRKKMLEDSPYRPFTELPEGLIQTKYVSFLNLVGDWEYERPLESYLELYRRNASPSMGYFPVVISVLILYPVGISGIYYLNKLVLDAFGLIG